MGVYTSEEENKPLLCNFLKYLTLVNSLGIEINAFIIYIHGGKA